MQIQKRRRETKENAGRGPRPVTLPAHYARQLLIVLIFVQQTLMEKNSKIDYLMSSAGKVEKLTGST